LVVLSSVVIHYKTKIKSSGSETRSIGGLSVESKHAVGHVLVPYPTSAPVSFLGSMGYERAPPSLASFDSSEIPLTKPSEASSPLSAIHSELSSFQPSKRPVNTPNNPPSPVPNSGVHLSVAASRQPSKYPSLVPVGIPSYTLLESERPITLPSFFVGNITSVVNKFIAECTFVATTKLRPQ